jgi:hypothetical protein
MTSIEQSKVWDGVVVVQPTFSVSQHQTFLAGDQLDASALLAQS